MGNTRLNFTDMLPYICTSTLSTRGNFNTRPTQEEMHIKLSFLPCCGPLCRPAPSLLVIFRLCTGHCHLNHHMSRIGLYPDWLCDQCEMPETVEHVIEVWSQILKRRDDV